MSETKGPSPIELGVEEEDRSKQHVVSISESMLMVDGKKIVEIGNPRYQEVPDMFEYNNEDEMLTIGERDTILEKDDLVKLKDGGGYITVGELFRDKTGVYSDRDVDVMYYKLSNSVKDSTQKLIYLARDLGLNHIDQRYVQDRLIRGLARENDRYSPNELYEAIIARIEDDLTEEELAKIDFDSIKKLVKKSGVLSLNENEKKAGIVDYFYATLMAKGVDMSNVDEILEKGLKDFQDAGDLVREFKKKPDSRFTGELLNAMSRFIDEEWEG